MKILVTGAVGFLGGHIAASLCRRGYEVTGLDAKEDTHSHPARASFARFVVNELKSPADVAHTLRSVQPDVAIHAAGPASVERSFLSPHEDLIAQIAPLSCLLEATKVASPHTRILLISSAAVYGNPKRHPVSENSEIAPISPYGHHKRAQELLLQEYASLYGLRVCAARVFSTFGPGLRQLAVWDIARRALTGDFSIHGAVDGTRDYLFVEQVAEALHSICDNAAFRGEAVNIGSGDEIRIYDLARRIYRALGINQDVSPSVCRDKQDGKPVHWRADVTILRGLGFEPHDGIDDGLQKTTAWIRLQ